MSFTWPTPLIAWWVVLGALWLLVEYLPAMGRQMYGPDWDDLRLDPERYKAALRRSRAFGAGYLLLGASNVAYLILARLDLPVFLTLPVALAGFALAIICLVYGFRQRIR